VKEEEEEVDPVMALTLLSLTTAKTTMKRDTKDHTRAIIPTERERDERRETRNESGEGEGEGGGRR